MQEWLVAHYEVLKDFSTPVLTLIGLLITICVAVAGFRTFDKWKREKIEEHRIEVSLKGLALAYESRIIFDEIRARFREAHEWDEMPDDGSHSIERRDARGSYWTTLKRI